MPGSVWAVLDLQPLHVAALISVAVFVMAVLAGQGIRAREAVRRRATTVTVFDDHANEHDGRSPTHAQARHSTRLMNRAARLMAPSEREALSAIRAQLVQAGYFSASAPAVFYASRMLLAIVLPLVFLAFAGLLPAEVPGALTLALAALLAVAGLILPAVFVDMRGKHMRVKYRHAFPDFMDLIVVCIESGQSLQGAIDRVSKEIAQSCPELGVNLHLVSLELRAGSTLTDALHGLFGRLGIEEVQSLAVLLKQSEELGASISATLRTYSDEMRDKRLSRAETKANSLPVKMTIPLGLFIFPVILLVIMVPVVIRIKNAFM